VARLTGSTPRPATRLRRRVMEAHRRGSSLPPVENRISQPIEASLVQDQTWRPDNAPGVGPNRLRGRFRLVSLLDRDLVLSSAVTDHLEDQVANCEGCRVSGESLRARFEREHVRMVER